MEEGFTDINIRYMGGFWVRLQFSSKISKENFMSHVGVNSWFSKIKQTSNSFYVDERVAWIEIEGVPLRALSHNTFSRGLCWKVFWIRVKELTGWAPNFKDMHDEESDSDTESVDSKIHIFQKDELSEIERGVNQAKGSPRKENDSMASHKESVNALVYAPQDLAEKKMLWNYLNLVINQMDMRPYLIGAAAFNSFISARGLMEVPTGGYSFTWSHKSAS
ncbi:hypothetical protein Tco_0632591 [Tanacetum coccineum]